ncbi:hypothetical protein [Tuwongella immobilis]|uniref:Uncharacterized protein n=1 Tax=Tuwongella immobilis TaxID=692036 RepID=A0A6C2YJ49_9BACT|nr:hypothetical protein [Tuwongella immobilis]VIP01163.1 unnamed protein product [Tuwongella immobilis]VTR97752.1 unnamed protein product [Tuwongella immobilis]
MPLSPILDCQHEANRREVHVLLEDWFEILDPIPEILKLAAALERWMDTAERGDVGILILGWMDEGFSFEDSRRIVQCSLMDLLSELTRLGIAPTLANRGFVEQFLAKQMAAHAQACRR